MKIVLFLAAVFSVAWAERDPKCAWGPSYWCSSLEVAKSCDAFDHCKATVWKNQILKQDTTDSCTFCKTFIDDVKIYIEQGKTKEEITHFLSSACGVIPDSKISDTCKHVVEFMIKEILALINTGVEAETVCKLMGLCGGMQDTVLHAPISEDQQPLVASGESTKDDVNVEPVCTDCKKFFNDIKDMITNNKTVTDVEQLIDQTVCSMLGPMRKQCMDVVHEFLPNLLKLLASYYDPNLICHSIGVCNADKKFYAKDFEQFVRLRQVPPFKASETSVASCTVCRAVLTELQTLVRDKSVQNAITNFMKNNFCSHIGSLKPVCEKGVDAYSREVFELLITILEPTSRCRSLGFCDAAILASYDSVNQSPAEKISPMLELIPAEYSPSDLSATKELKMTMGPQCVLCHLIMKELIGLIGTKATEKSIISALEKVCRRMPKALVHPCTDFVDTYGPAVIKMFLQRLDPNLFCTFMHLCDRRATTDSPGGVLMAQEIVKPVQPVVPVTDESNNEGCAVCVLVIQYVESMLEQNASIAEIQSLLDRVCYHLPQKYIDKCQNLVKKYTDVLIHYISTMATPQEICMLIGVCDKKVDSRPSGSASGQNECIWGASYWCVSHDSAEKCNAVDYCKRFVWKGVNV